MKYRDIVKAINEILDSYTILLTVRQIFYRLISPPYQLFEGNNRTYNSYNRMITKARERGHVNWRRIEDRSRSMYGGDNGFDSIEDFMEQKLTKFKENQFSMPLWTDQPLFPILVVEKDALTTQCKEIADRYNVITYPSRGYSSFTMLKNLVVNYGGNGKKVVILHLTDHDPSGLNMTEDMENRLGTYGLHNFEIKRIALTYSQVQEHNLLQSPNTVKKTDTRWKRYYHEFGDRTWELDALDPAVLQQIIDNAIRSCVDEDIWNDRIEEIDNNRKDINQTLSKISIVLNSMQEYSHDWREGC